MKRILLAIPFAIALLANACTDEVAKPAPVQLSENLITFYIEPDSIKVNKANTEGSLFHFVAKGTYYDKKGSDKSQIDPNGYIDPHYTPTNPKYKAKYYKLASESGDTCYNKEVDMNFGACLCDSLLKIEIISDKEFAGKQPGENIAEHFKFYGYSPLEYIRNGYKDIEQNIEDELVTSHKIGTPFHFYLTIENAENISPKNSRFLKNEFYLYMTEKSEIGKDQTLTFTFYFTQKTVKTTSTI